MPESEGKPRPDPDTRARTHLANERTFLAWLRTGLSLIALGLGAAQFLQPDLLPQFPISTVFAVLLIAGGIAMVVVGAVHYNESRAAIDAGSFTPLTRAVIVTAALVGVAGVFTLVLVILLRRNS